MTSSPNIHDDVMHVLTRINDPEMPISIVDLGIVDGVENDDGRVTVRILPTFVGCPALDMLKEEIVRKLSTLAGVRAVSVEFAFNPPWTPERISPAGRENLRQFGVTVPHLNAPDDAALPVASPLVQIGLPARIACPFCGEDDTTLTSPFGPTRCRMIYYCEACKNQFEHMKSLPAT